MPSATPAAWPPARRTADRREPWSRTRAMTCHSPSLPCRSEPRAATMPRSRGGERQGRRKPDGHFDPEHEHRDESPTRAECLSDPPEDSALLRPSRREFSRHQRDGNQEYDGSEQIIEYRAQPIFRLGRKAAKADDRDYIHDRKRENAQLASRRNRRM